MPREICPHCNMEVEFAYGKNVPCPECREKVNVFDDEHPLETTTVDRGSRVSTPSDYTPRETKRHEGRPGSTPPAHGGITYKQIGGLDDVIFQLDLMINGAKAYPDLWRRMGRKKARGILLIGPPGCGKTLLAQALANETGKKSCLVQGAEIKGWRQGASEQNLISAYESVRPNGILIIDEIDSIGGKREKMVNETNTSVVGTLLSIVDGAKYKDDVIIIGTTNRPYMLDDGLRRPGRFDAEINILPPDINGRIQVFSIHTAGMPLAHDINIEELARQAHGFTGADIAGACSQISRQMFETGVRRIRAGDPQNRIIKDMEISQKEFSKVIEDTLPSMLRENHVEVSTVQWQDIGGLANIKQELQDMVSLPLLYAQHIKTMKLRQPKGMLLYGAPGCGKTLIAKAMAYESGYNFIAVNGPALLTKWIGDAEEGIRDAFYKARLSKPCIIFFDELDAIAPVRGKSDVMDRVVGQLLSEMDGVSPTEHVFVMGTTNRLDLIDPALLRPGRFDLPFEVPKPDKNARGEIIAIHLREVPVRNVHIDELTQPTDGFTGADLEWMCTLAKKRALKRCIASKNQPLEIIHDDLLHGIQEVKERNQ